MATVRETKEYIENGLFDASLLRLVGLKEERLQQERKRYREAVEEFAKLYGDERIIEIYTAPGRTEIGGNHTDHNQGKVLAAAIDLDMIAVVSQNHDNIVRVHSRGFSPDEVHLNHLTPQKREAGRSAALIRGVASGIQKQAGVIGGLDVYMTSDVLKGSGLSSSAAYEVCLGAIFNGIYNAGKLTPVELAKIGQYAENIFFDKPSGLMDQLACAIGGAVAIDFADPLQPKITKIPFKLDEYGFSLVITDTGGDHANLTEDYTAIRREMEEVAAFFNQNTLGHVPRESLMKSIPQLRSALGDRPILRAIHFFEECRRVEVLASALQEGDINTFLKTIIESGHSSFEYNQNAYSPKQQQRQEIPLALALSQWVLGQKGAWRLQGGGFAGTTQAFVPAEMLPNYTDLMTSIFGCNACHVLSIRQTGCAAVRPMI